ncbi:cucurbitadienol 11-hydroxylase-like [Populus nigra]|uniref:cucurbitadienol 11-hydroxylase-like n=1 Tax=Populus nigra TaxID=3691 RepID=UPI002B27B79A|nr:cucurbitadienol 11-hydroxylase-like [Populus nigra]
MWAIGLVVVALVVIYYTHMIFKWRSPKIEGVLPPGSMGWPLIGETLQFIIPGKSLDLHPFVKKRMQKYGPIFKTSLVGRPIIVSTDYEMNKYILQHEGTLVELWYLDSFAKFFALEGETRVNAIGTVHKYLRSITLNHFGVESLKESLLPKIEDMLHTNLAKWASQGPVDVKQVISVMVFNFTANKIFGYDAENSKEKLSENYTKILNSFISLPLNIPGTSFHKCMQDREKMLKMLKDTLMERLNDPSKRRGDFLDQAIDDMKTEKFLTEDFIPQLMFGILFASFESMSTTLTLTFKFLTENPRVVEELRAEHEAIVKKRENPNSRLTWEEYRSMTFTQMVVNETLRISNIPPGLFRKALKDFQVKGYTVPAGWTVMLVTPATQLNPDTFKDPVTFNPWRWQELDQVTISKNFMPFGGGTRQCAGAEYSKLVLSTFLHILVTDYSFTKIRGGDVSRTPIISFGDGIHIKFTARA